MGVVTAEREVFVAKGVDVVDGRIERHRRQRPRLAAELELRLFQVVFVEVQIAEGVDEIAGREVADLGDHHGEECVAGDIERHAEEQVSAALVKLAAQAAIEDEELEKRVTGRERHLRDFTGIPRGHDVAPRVGVCLDLRDDAVELVDVPAIGGAPVAPLRPIDTAEIAVGVGPFIPDAHPVRPEVADVGIAGDEPEQFVDDRFEVELFGGEQREAFREVEAGLGTEDGERAGAGAVGFEAAFFEDELKEIEIGAHRVRMLQDGTSRCKARLPSAEVFAKPEAWAMVAVPPMTMPSTIRPILERFAYVVYLATLAGSISGLWLGWLTGVATGDFRAMIAALGGLALTRWLHVRGYGHWHFTQCGASLDTWGAGNWEAHTAVERAQAEEVATLLARLAVEEEVWERAELRRQIAARLAASPALRDEFAGMLAEHPEIQFSTPLGNPPD